MVKKRRISFILLLMAVLLLSFPGIVSAKTVNGKKVSQWTGSKGNYYYLDSKGNKVTGLQKIKGKYYLFDSNGIQRYGWRKINGNYYYFKIAKKADGCMITGKKINGVTLDKSGKAKLSTSRIKRKLNVMVQINSWVDSITKNWMTKEKKLKTCFDHLRKKIPYRYVSSFRKWDSNWDLWGVEYVLKNRKSDCYPFAATFAYMANAIGYTKIYTCSSGVHGWTEINGRVYDVSLARHNLKSYSLFNKAYNNNYRCGRTYVKSVDK